MIYYIILYYVISYYIILYYITLYNSKSYGIKILFSAESVLADYAFYCRLKKY